MKRFIENRPSSDTARRPLPPLAGNLLFLGALFAMSLLVMAIEKPLFLLWYHAQAAEASAAELALVVWNGLKLDQTVAGYITALPLLVVLAALWIPGRWSRSVLKGYLLSVALGTVLGSLMGMSKTIANLLQPTVTVIRQIPIIAWIPLIILWCGIGELSKVVVIVMAAFFPIMMNTMSGISSTPAGYIEVAQLYKLNYFKTFRKVYLPHALPQILVGLKLGLGISWMAVVAAELIASLSGIGYRMSNARSLMQSDMVIVCMIVIGVIGILMDKILGAIFTAITPWNKGNTK